MTIASSTNKTSPFAGNDTTGPWAFTFKTFDEADLEVVKLVSGVESVLVLNTDYTVSLNGDQEASPGGDITTTANVATGETLVIRRVVEALQGVDLVQGGAFNPSVLEDALDRLTMLAQQLEEEVDRSVKVDLTSGDDPDTLVATILAAEASASADAAAAAVDAAAAAASAASIDPNELIHRDGSVAMTGAFNAAYATVASHATTADIWGAAGNTINWTGTATTTAFPNAPQAGAERTLICAGAAVFTAGANMLIDGVGSGSNFTAAAGDKIIVRAVSTTQFRLTPQKYDGTAVISGMPRSYLAGLGIANNGTDATNDIDVAVGACRDSTNAVDMVLASALTKRLDAAWAVGTNQGGLDTGSIANTTYYVWLIKRSDTGVVDALFSVSATAPTMPTNYNYKRLIGRIVRAAGAIYLFTQQGDCFFLKTPVQDANTTIGVTRTLVGVTAPPGTVGKFRIYAYNSGSTCAFVFQPTYETDAAPATAGMSQRSEVSNQGTAGEYEILVDSSRQIAARASVAASIITIWTIGWRDRRGQDD